VSFPVDIRDAGWYNIIVNTVPVNALEIFKEKLDSVLSQRDIAFASYQDLQKMLEERGQEVRRLDTEVLVARSWIEDELRKNPSADVALPSDETESRTDLSHQGSSLNGKSRHTRSKGPTVMELVLEFLMTQTGEFKSSSAVSAVLRKSPTSNRGTIYNVLGSCVKQGILRRVSDGVYAVAGSSTTAASN